MILQIVVAIMQKGLVTMTTKSITSHVFYNIHAVYQIIQRKIKTIQEQAELTALPTRLVTSARSHPLTLNPAFPHFWD